MALNKCTQTGTFPVIESQQQPEIRHRVKCPATGQATAWGPTIPEVEAAWNAVHPAPEPEIPAIPLLPQDKSV